MLKILDKLKKRYTREEQKQFDFFRKNMLLQNLNNKELTYVIEGMHLRQYKEDEIVFFRNDPALALYIVKDGDVSLDCDFGEKNEKLNELKKGMVFGFEIFSHKEPRLYNATVKSESAQLYVWPSVSIREIFMKHPEIQVKIQRELVRYYEGYLSKLFDTYREAYGFFQLSELYHELNHIE